MHLCSQLYQCNTECRWLHKFRYQWSIQIKIPWSTWILGSSLCIWVRNPANVLCAETKNMQYSLLVENPRNFTIFSTVFWTLLISSELAFKKVPKWLPVFQKQSMLSHLLATCLKIFCCSMSIRSWNVPSMSCLCPLYVPILEFPYTRPISIHKWTTQYKRALFVFFFPCTRTTSRLPFQFDTQGFKMYFMAAR